MKPKMLESTLTEIVSDQLMNDIVAGVFAPDEKLKIENLKQRYKIGASPLREALARLIALGFVTTESRKGFRVAPMSVEDLRDMTLCRQMVERTALAKAIQFGDKNWESGIVESLARLTWMTDQFRDGKCLSTEVDNAHFSFHRSLISACRSPRLILLQENFFNQAKRYRHIMMKVLIAGPNFSKSHRRLAKVTLERDTSKACFELSQHLDTLEKFVYPTQKVHHGGRSNELAKTA